MKIDKLRSHNPEKTLCRFTLNYFSKQIFFFGWKSTFEGWTEGKDSTQDWKERFGELMGDPREFSTREARGGQGSSEDRRASGLRHHGNRRVKSGNRLTDLAPWVTEDPQKGWYDRVNCLETDKLETGCETRGKGESLWLELGEQMGNAGRWVWEVGRCRVMEPCGTCRGLWIWFWMLTWNIYYHT